MWEPGRGGDLDWRLTPIDTCTSIFSKKLKVLHMITSISIHVLFYYFLFYVENNIQPGNRNFECGDQQTRSPQLRD